VATTGSASGKHPVTAIVLQGRQDMDIESKPSTLVNLVDYSEGAVVSRTLIKKPTGTVTLFAFDQGQGLSEHTAPFDALVCVLDGQVEITISGKPVLLKQGETIIMPADQPHALKAGTRFKMLLTMIKS
jgi:quercetin dioxygenase-like cupin family protein